MEQYKGIGYLRSKLAIKQTRVRRRYDYYEMKHIANDFHISTPPALAAFMSVLGWCAKAVDSLADRLQFREFDNDNFAMNEIYRLNNADILFDSAVTSALISSCCFIYISTDEDGYPRLQVIDGYNATGIIDPITNMLTEGYAVLNRDDKGVVLTEAYFVAGRTDIYQKGSTLVDSYYNNAPYALLVPIIYRPDAVRPFGHSRISRACMSIVDSAARTVKRSEIASEFYSFPQKYILGMNNDAEEFDKWKVTMSSLLRIDKDEDGDVPTVGQFSQQSTQPHIDQLKMFASLFAGETGLTLDDLGFSTDNPSSAEAIKSTHENLRMAARKAQRDFGAGFLNAGYLASCVRDDFPYLRNQIYETKALWEPVFEPDASQLSLIGDGAIKINQAIPDYFDKKVLRNLTGIEAGGNEGYST